MITLAKSFAPAADEVWRLQRDDDPECRWFRQAVRGKPDAVRGSMQGTYVLTPKGRMLGRLNSANPDRVLAMLTEALEAWRALPASERAAPEARLRSSHRWEDSYPEGGLVLERYARDIPSDPEQPPIPPVNRDAVWFTAREAKGWLPELRVGAKAVVNKRIVDRLARLVFVDNVRGQTLPFARTELGECRLDSEVLAIRGSEVVIQITGGTRANALGPWVNGDNYWKPKGEWPRSMQARVFGLATFDRDAGQFTHFELVAAAAGKGRTAFNGRRRLERDATLSIGFLLRLAPASYRVAPTFVNMYGTKWVVPPPAESRRQPK